MSINILLIDSNLLLLYIVGTTNRSYIGKHKRLQAYSELDYDLLLEVIDSADRVSVTPNTLSETSNLLDHIHDPIRKELFLKLKEVIAITDEIYHKSSDATKSDAFSRLGLTDTVLADLCNGETCLITVDFDLYDTTLRSGGNVINFNHLRAMIESGVRADYI